jgi:hypothetical protein
MNICDFKEATHFIAHNALEHDNIVEKRTQYYTNGTQSVFCVEISAEDLKKLQKDKKFYVVMQAPTPVPMIFQCNTPFATQQMIEDYGKATEDEG